MLLPYALARPIVSTFGVASSNNSTILDSTTGECVDINNCRTTMGIVSSCLSVIFICTWVAIHPNIPIVGTHWVVVIYHNVLLTIIAILVPEIMILWAMRQRVSAIAIAKEFKEYGWGMTHGFFVLMGGFALYDGEKFCGYLWESNKGYDEYRYAYDGHAEEYWEEIRKHHAKICDDVENTATSEVQQVSQCNQDVAFFRHRVPPEVKVNPTQAEAASATPEHPRPELLKFLVSKGYLTITEDEIKDKSHGDLVSKSIAVVQTTWFILQVVSRIATGLAVTELEIITVAFALLSFATYFLWLNKPLRARHPIRIQWQLKEPNGNVYGWMYSVQDRLYP